MQLFRERWSEKCEPTILKGNMGYDQYTVPHTTAVEPTLFCFPSALADINLSLFSAVNINSNVVCKNWLKQNITEFWKKT